MTMQSSRGVEPSAGDAASNGSASRSEAVDSDNGDQESEPEDDDEEPEIDRLARTWCACGIWKAERSRRMGSRPFTTSASQHASSSSSADSAGAATHASISTLDGGEDGECLR